MKDSKTDIFKENVCILHYYYRSSANDYHIRCLCRRSRRQVTFTLFNGFFALVFILRFQRFWARVLKVYPPKHKQSPSSPASGSNSLPPEERIEPHRIFGDLKVPVSELNATDNPKEYYYKVQLSEDGYIFDEDTKGKGKASGKFVGSVMIVRCDCMRSVITYITYVCF
jgi:hypothetical protein